MTKKLKFLVGESLKRKIKTKWFVAANILILIVILCLFNIDGIIKFFGGDFNDNQIIYVNDKSNMTYETLKLQNKNYTKLLDDDEEVFELKKTDKSSEEIFKDEDNKDAWYLTINSDENNTINAELISDGYINSYDFAQISGIINSAKQSVALSLSDIDPVELAKISESVDIERVILDENKKGEEEGTQMIMSTVFPFVILPFFILSLFLVQMVGAEVNDEKSTRGMEIIISSVSPKVHFFSKVIASNLFVLIQGALLVVFVVLGLVSRMLLGGTSITDIPASAGVDISGMINSILSSDVINELVYIIPLVIILMLVTFLAYSLLAGVLASMTTNIEDFQQLQTPIMIISLIGYYLAIMAGVFEGSLFIKILAFFPFISAILAPSLLVLGQIGVFEFIVAILIMVIVVFLLIKYGLKIYKVGILNYSSKNLWKKMFKALRG